MGNTFGTLYRLTTFGESHGPAVGGIVDGLPAGIQIDEDFIQKELDRRRPGQSTLTTSRKETDRVELLSGVFEGRSTGCPIGFLVRNADHHSADYANVADKFRPSHADYTYTQKYGLRDYRGGGRSSARETISRVVGGALAKLALQASGIQIKAYTSQVGPLALEGSYRDYDLDLRENNPVRCPDEAMAARMAELIRQVKGDGDTVGGRITCVISGCPVGLGEPVADKFHARLASAMLSINAAKGFEYGDICQNLDKRGSELNDLFVNRDGRIRTLTNHSGGIQGGITNGEDIYFTVAFKPVATVLREQQTVDAAGRPVMLTMRGRHDPCVLPRAVPIVEAMAAMTTLDALLLARASRPF